MINNFDIKESLMSAEEIRKIINLMEAVQNRKKLNEFKLPKNVIDFKKFSRGQIHNLLKHQAVGLEGNVTQLPADSAKYRKILTILPIIKQLLPLINKAHLDQAHDGSTMLFGSNEVEQFNQLATKLLELCAAAPIVPISELREFISNPTTYNKDNVYKNVIMWFEKVEEDLKKRAEDPEYAKAMDSVRNISEVYSLGQIVINGRTFDIAVVLTKINGQAVRQLRTFELVESGSHVEIHFTDTIFLEFNNVAPITKIEDLPMQEIKQKMQEVFGDTEIKWWPTLRMLPIE